MITTGDVRLLLQYISSLDEATERLEEAYAEKNLEEMKKIKGFMLDVKYKISSMLAK